MARALLLLCALAAAACANLDQERNLAPLFAEYSPGGGGKEIEALAGAVVVHRPTLQSAVDAWYTKPLASWRRQPDGVEFTWILPPFGYHKRTATTDSWVFRPLYRFDQRFQEDGSTTWTWISLPGIYWAKTADGRIVRAWFPFGGVVEHFLSFDRAEFVLFPLYSRFQRHGRTTYNVLWPFFTWSTGAGGPSWHVWPLIGHKKWEGRYDRWYFLWPIFQFQKNELKAAPENQGRAWAVFPLYQERHQASLHSISVLWPFFGYAWDEKSGFWAWDGPWPLVRFMEPGSSNSATRWRMWPFYSYYEGDGLTSRYYLWPFICFRREQYRDSYRNSAYVIPFWQSSDRLHQEEGHSTYRKLWPAYRSESKEGWSFFAFPALNPLWRTLVIDEHWAWIWELYTREERDDALRERSWLGLWRHEHDRDEDRVALSGLWGRRRYSLAGKRVTESSWLFGLLRFRSTEGEGMDWLRPAMPGPGWPLERVPNSILPAEEE